MESGGAGGSVNLRWGWILLGGFLAELAIFVVVIPLSLLAGEASLDYAAPPASFVATFALGFWVARKVPRHRVLHGALVGVVAVVILLAMTLDQPQSVAYIVAHLLKVLGGIAGGLFALKRSTAHVIADTRQV